MWTDSPRPTIIAHRGDKAHAPENTLAAFEMAAEKGADALEFDVKLTADGRVVIIHDQTVDRTSSGTGDVSKYQFSALQELDAGAWFSESFRGERIPSLEDVFETVGKRLRMNIELTNYANPGDTLVPRVVELVKKYDMQSRVLFSSFFPRNLRKAERLLPEVPRGLLTMPGLLGAWGRLFSWRGDYFSLHSHLSDLTPGLVDRVHAAGKRIQVWTVNAASDLKRVTGFGVDGIFTDDPGLALHLLGRSQ